MKKLTMTLSSADVTLTDGRGSVTASVNNASAAPERVVLGAFPAGLPTPGAAAPVPAAGTAAASTPAAPTPSPGASYATVDRPLRTLQPGATEQFEVKFDTTGLAVGSHPVKLIPYSADEAPEDYAELGHVVQLTVTEPPKVVKKKFPWWIVVVAALVLIGAAIAVFLLTRADPPVTDPTPTASSTPTPTPETVVLELSSFDPSRGPVSGNFPVTLFGRFVDPTTVSVGETEIPATRVSDTEYTFTIPPGTQPGQVQLTVTSAGERVGVAIFEYQTPPTPPSGGGDVFTPICVSNPEVCFFVDEVPRLVLPDDFVFPDSGIVDPGDVLIPEDRIRIPLNELEFQR